MAAARFHSQGHVHKPFVHLQHAAASAATSKTRRKAVPDRTAFGSIDMLPLLIKRQLSRLRGLSPANPTAWRHSGRCTSRC